MIYLLIPAVFIFLMLFKDIIGKQKSSKLAFTASFLVIFLLLVLRSYYVGIDTERYVDAFIKAGESTWENIFQLKNEWLFYILCKITYLICPHPNFFFAVVGLLTTLPILIMYIKNIKEAPVVSMMVFLSMSVFSMIFSGMRQAIAIAIMCVGYKYLKERKFFKYLLCVLLASMFHASAIVCIVFYLMYMIPLSKNSFPIVFIIIILTIIFRNQIANLILQIMTAISGKYEYYQPLDTGAFMAVIVYCVILAIFYLFNPTLVDEIDRNKLYRLYDNVVIRKGRVYDKKINILFTLILIQIFAAVNYGAARISMYIIAWLPMVVSEYFDSYNYVDRDEDKFIFSVGFLIVFTYQFINDIVIHGGLGLLPYIPFWEVL